MQVDQYNGYITHTSVDPSPSYPCIALHARACNAIQSCPRQVFLQMLLTTDRRKSMERAHDVIRLPPQVSYDSL